MVSTRIASNNNGLRPLLQRTMPCPFAPRGTTVCGGTVRYRDSGVSLCQRLNSLPEIASGTCPQKGLTAWAITTSPSSLWTQSVIRLRRSEKSLLLWFYFNPKRAKAICIPSINAWALDLKVFLVKRDGVKPPLPLGLYRIRATG